MALFAKKSASQLQREIKVLEKRNRIEEKRKNLTSKENALRSKLRSLKYAKLYEARDKAASFGGRLGSGILRASGNVYGQLKHNKVSPAFKASFPAGSMVGVGKPGPAPSFRDNTDAFKVRFKK